MALHYDQPDETMEQELHNDPVDHCDGYSDHSDFSFPETVHDFRSFRYDAPLHDDEDALSMAHNSMSPSSTPGRRTKIFDPKGKPSIINKQSFSTNNHNYVSKASALRTSTRGEVKSSAVIRAENVRSHLDPGYPSFVKTLVRSHVAGCFWMGLPGLFCKRHLPSKDTTMILEDEAGKEFKSKYIAYKTGLSAGWRHFSVAHKLVEGDAVVFQLVEPERFKVYIIRANNLTEVDGALDLLNLDASPKQNRRGQRNSNTGAWDCDTSNRKRPKSIPDVQRKKKAVTPGQTPAHPMCAEPSEYDSEDVGSQVLEGLRPSLTFKDVKSFGNFRIIVDDVDLDSEFSDEIRIKYFKLCCSQQAFLHDNLIRCLNYMLIVGMICETVKIADGIKTSTLCTSRAKFTKWDKTLLAFENLGLRVQFLRLRLRRLVSLSFESEGAAETRTYLEARTERSRAVEEISNIERKLQDLKGACDGFGSYLRSMKSKTEGFQLKFNADAMAPW